MKNSVLYYSVGPLLYCPANKSTIADAVISQTLGTRFSLALCLEDTIRDDCVMEAEAQLIHSIQTIYQQSLEQAFYLPKIFIRVRSPEQMLRLSKTFQQSMEIISGFIFPKFSLENADAYIQAAIKINESCAKPIYIMPIYESACIVDLQKRYDILYGLKDKLASVEDRVLGIRVGGNDLCHLFGFRRHASESIHQLKPIADIFSDIITVYGLDYVVSGPVWEYYRGADWQQGLRKELSDDRLCGFIGKTVIHPNQIELVNTAYQVLESDWNDAHAILDWNPGSRTLVSGSAASGNTANIRMNEYKSHTNWARQTLLMAEAYGIKKE